MTNLEEDRRGTQVRSSKVKEQQDEKQVFLGFQLLVI